MSRVLIPRTLRRRDICELLQADAPWLIRKEGQRYEREIAAVAWRLHETMPARCLVLLSGPSASGKTTTALKLQEQLRALGRETYTVSLDNFYRGYGHAPQLPDGSFDYETVEALNVPLLEQCMQELILQGRTQLPVFDFLTHAPKAERVELCIPEHAVVIFEGIHALNPLLLHHLPSDCLFRIFINVMSSITDDGEVLLSQQDMRLVRRLLRDIRFRNSGVENTMDMWRQVTRGEELYLFPHADTANVAFDTTHAYESAMLGVHLIPLLRAVPETSPYAITAVRLADALSRFTPLSEELLPADALLREFIG